MIAGGWGGGAVPNATGTAEFAIDVSGVDAQAATGGVRINFIPRDGGNRFEGTLVGSFAGEGFASDNFTGSDVQARGLSTPNRIKQNGDFNPGFGGPIKRDSLWFFLSARYVFAENYVAGRFFNENVNRLDRFDYVLSTRQAILHQDQQIAQGRSTWQVNQTDKIGVSTHFEAFCSCTPTISATTATEAGVDRRFAVQRFVTMDWTSPVSNRLLPEASAIHRVERWGGMHPQVGKAGNIEALTPGMISVTDNPSRFNGASLTYRAGAQFNNSWNWNLHYRAAASYITGSHSFKVGINNARGYHDNTTYTDPAAPFSYSFANGLPTSITYRIAPRTVRVNVDRDLGLFAQDRWTTGRWTLSGGIRYDNFKNSFPETAIAGTFFGRTLNVQFPDTDNLNWHDITPKLGATWDMFGNGRTALKLTLNKYLEGLGTTGFGAAQVTDAPHPIARLSGVTVNSTRTWGDANGNFIPDCNLNDFGISGECGPLSGAATFGTLVPGITYDPELLEGWGKRSFNWEFTTAVQHELMPRLGLEVQYARRWYGNIRVTDDRAVGPADYQRFTFTVPGDARLPDGGGYTLTGFDLTSAAAPDYFVTLSDNFGKMGEHFDGVNISVNARLQNGLRIQGGLGTGRQLLDDCELVEELPEMLHTFFGNPNRFFAFAARPLERCEENNGWRTSLQGLAAYIIPRIDVQVSATWQSLPGVQLAANNNTPVSSTTLGRGFSGLAPFRAYNIVEAGQVFIERLNQIDFRA